MGTVAICTPEAGETPDASECRPPNSIPQPDAQSSTRRSQATNDSDGAGIRWDRYRAAARLVCSSLRMRSNTRGNRRACSADEANNKLELADHRWPVIFSLEADRLFTAAGHEELPEIHTAREEMSLQDYLNASPPHLFTADFDRLRGREIFRAPERSREGAEIFDPDCFRPIDWLGQGAVLNREFGWTGTPYTREGFDPASLHGQLAEYLETEGFPLILYDHSTGEIADFIVFEEHQPGAPKRWRSNETELENAVHVFLLHVKGASARRPGNRLADVYEVSGQVVKSLVWLKKRRLLADRLRHRCENTSFFLRGDPSTAQQFLRERQRPVRFHIGLVQPGVTARKAQPRTLEVLASADDYVRSAVGTPLFVLCSP